MAIELITNTLSNLMTYHDWDVQVLKSQKIEPQSDDYIWQVKHSISNVLDWASGSVSNAWDSIWNKDKKPEAYVSIGEFDSFVSFNGTRDSQVVQNAVENGSFRSVNKIRKPNTCIVELAKGGMKADVQVLLDLLRKYQGSTFNFRVVTPFGSLSNLNLVKFEYQHAKGNNANMLLVKLHFQEIMYGYGESFTVKQVSSPDKTNIKDGGQVAVQGGK